MIYHKFKLSVKNYTVSIQMSTRILIIKPIFVSLKRTILLTIKTIIIMKKTLLLSAMAFIVILGANAQTTIWNLGGDQTVATNGSTAWLVSAGLALGVGNPATAPGGVETFNGLTISTGLVSSTSTSPCGIVSASVKSFTSTGGTAYTFANRFLLNGSGYPSAAATDVTPLVNMPTARYGSFQVNGNCTIYMIGMTGSNASSRKMFVTDGTTYIGSVDFPGQVSGTPPLNDGTVTYTGPATTLYLFGNSSVALYYLSATNVLIAGVNPVLTDKGVSFNGTEILNTKGLSLEVYSVLGKRVASSLTSIPTANFQKGVYIVRVSGTNDSLKICI